MNKQREALRLALEALIEVTGWQWAGPMRVMDEVEDAISAIREALAEPEQKLDSALEALQNEMRETISKLDPNEMVWIHQPSGMPPILCKEPVVGAVPVCATASARKPVGTVTGWYGGHPVIEPIGDWIPVVGTVLYSAPPARKPLSEQQILELLPDAQHGWTTATYGKWVARAIERAHGITE